MFFAVACTSDMLLWASNLLVHHLHNSCRLCTFPTEHSIEPPVQMKNISSLASIEQTKHLSHFFVHRWHRVAAELNWCQLLTVCCIWHNSQHVPNPEFFVEKISSPGLLFYFFCNSSHCVSFCWIKKNITMEKFGMCQFQFSWQGNHWQRAGAAHAVGTNDVFCDKHCEWQLWLGALCESQFF